jgi:hypothetical protein
LHIEELIEDTISAELLAMNSAGTGDGNSSSAAMSGLIELFECSLK